MITIDLLGKETDDGEPEEAVLCFLPDENPRYNPWFKDVAQSSVRLNKLYEKVWMGEYKRCEDDK